MFFIQQSILEYSQSKNDLKYLCLNDIGYPFFKNMSFRNVIHKLLNFHLANQKLQDSLNCKFCQRNLLITEVILKTSRLRVLNNEFYLLHSKFDFAHVFSPFLSSNDVILKSHDSFNKKHSVFFLKIASQNITQMELF